MLYRISFDNQNIEIRAIKEGIFRIRLSNNKEFKTTLLSEYNIINEPKEELESTLIDGDVAKVNAGSYTLEIDKQKSKLTFSGGKHPVSFTLSGRAGTEYNNSGFRIEIPILDSERLFGLGDESREVLMKRGRKAIMWQKNVVSYGPIPYMMSSDGWGMMTNCTYQHQYDLGATINNKILIDSDKGVIDFYVFLSDSMKNVIGLYTDIAGKPIMLPKSAYGFTFVANEEDGARELLSDCLSFRREDIPCDIMGLEPGWMDKHYDYRVDKKWSPERFYIPYWMPENYSGTWSFFYNLRQMGFKLSLWLCCDYDLLWHEEVGQIKCQENSYEGAAIVDEHFSGDVLMDHITKPGEAWFEHLKKFVDQGVIAFKLDGALQVMEHPDRLWAGKYLDDEVHNIYPVIYAKQMKEGFLNYTGRRALIYTPSLYAGTQQYAATWAGDTGGGENTLICILNLSLCGHTNASCDLDPTNPMGIHYGFLMPWSQLLAWRNWHHPWLLGDELEGIIRDYSKLRSSLFPYIYSMAHIASTTGLAIARPLCLMYPEESKYDNVKNMYMFGDSFLVGAFDMNLTLPEGKWIDYFTGDTYNGNQTILYTPPKGKGGALFVKEGSVFVTQEPMKYLDEKTPEIYHINVYPGKDCGFTLIEDDGVTYDYLTGGFASTQINVVNSGENGFDLVIGERKGEFSGREYDVDTNVDIDDSAPMSSYNDNAAGIYADKINGIQEVTDFDVNIFMDGPPKSITLNNKNVSFTHDGENLTRFLIPKSLHKDKSLTYSIRF